MACGSPRIRQKTFIDADTMMLQRGGQVGSGEPYHCTTAVPMQSKETPTKVQIARENGRGWGGGRGGEVKHGITGGCGRKQPSSWGWSAVGAMNCPKAPPRCAGDWCRESWRVPHSRLAEGPTKRRNAVAGTQQELKFLQSFLGNDANFSAQPPPADSCRPSCYLSLREALQTPFFVGALGAHDAQTTPW